MRAGTRKAGHQRIRRYRPRIPAPRHRRVPGRARRTHDRSLRLDHCTTAANPGFETVVVTGATATFDREGSGDVWLTARENHDAALCHLHEEFATVLDTADLC